MHRRAHGSFHGLGKCFNVDGFDARHYCSELNGPIMNDLSCKHKTVYLRKLQQSEMALHPNVMNWSIIIMVVYSFYIFDRHGLFTRTEFLRPFNWHCSAECIYSKRWLPQTSSSSSKTTRPPSGTSVTSNGEITVNQRKELSKKDDAKLIFGVVFSLRNLASRIGGEDYRFAANEFSELFWTWALINIVLTVALFPTAPASTNCTITKPPQRSNLSCSPTRKRQTYALCFIRYGPHCTSNMLWRTPCPRQSILAA